MTEFNPGGAASLNEAVKLRYEANADTNAFTDAEKAKLAGIAPGAGAYVHPDHTGDVLSAGDGATTIAAGAVTNGKLAPVAQGTLKGRAGAGAGSPEDLDAAAARALLNVADGATANASDAALRDRATHTGTQPLSSVAGLETALSAKAGIVHGHAIADVSGLQGTLDAKVDAAGLAAVATSGSAADLSSGTLPAARFSDTAHGSRAGGTLHAAATTSTAGFMSGADKTKLDGIAAGATANATDAQLRDRVTHTGSQAIGTVTGLQAALDGKAASGHGHAAATGSADGFLSASDKTKLDGIAAGANAYAHPNHSGDVTSAGDGATTIAPNAVTYSKMQDVGGASRLLGRGAGAGGGDPQEITLGSGLTMTGTTLSATGGGGGASDPLDLAVTDPAPPPAGLVRLFRREIAMRQMPAFKGPSGLDSALQPLLARNKVGYWCPPGNAATVPGVLGITAFTATGTATARNVAATNLFTRLRRLGYVSATTAGSLAGPRVAVLQFTTGDGAGLGGFFMIVRFGVSAFTSDMRMFVGMRNVTAAPANSEPSTFTQCVGVGCGAADGNLSLYHGGTSAQTPIALGASFPAKTANADVYELALFAPPSVTGTIHYEVSRLNTGDVAAGTLSGGAAVVPDSSQLLCGLMAWVSNNATAAAVALDIASYYIETDY